MLKRKIFKILTSALLVGSMLTLCACSKEAPTNQQSSSTKKEEKKEDTKNPYSDLKIGVINIGASTDTAGYTYAHIAGIKGMLSTLNMKDDQVIYKDDIPDKEGDLETIKKAIQECIDSGCKIIFSTSFGFAKATEEMAAKYPDVYFSHCSGSISNGKNMNRYFGKIYQPFYLAGIAAGLKTTTNKIGFVSAWGNVVSESAYCLNAFAMGVESVNPRAKVYSYAINSWGDENLEKTAATFLVSHGADVVAQDTDSSQPALVAQANKAFNIGYNSDMSKDAPNSTLMSVIWNWSSYYTYAVQSIVEGKWDCANYFGGFKEGTVGITDLATFNNPTAATKITEATNKFTSGEWDVFTGVLTTNTGQTVGTANTPMNEDDIQFKTNWLYKNIKVVK